MDFGMSDAVQRATRKAVQVLADQAEEPAEDTSQPEDPGESEQQ
jgi:hypothetical protein